MQPTSINHIQAPVTAKFSNNGIHGTDVNLDTGVSAEYKELSKSSAGDLWRASNADEIGRIFQGLGPTSYILEGTNTLFLNNKGVITKHTKPTYIRVVYSDRLEKQNTKWV